MRPASASPLLDVVTVLAFATVGRATHAEGLSVLGVLQTAWPFAVGLLLGWSVALAVTSARRAVHLGSLRAGAVVWACTVPTGMALRTLTDQGTATAFVVVAAVTLAAGLLGWRLLARRLRVRRRRT